MRARGDFGALSPSPPVAGPRSAQERLSSPRLHLGTTKPPTLGLQRWAYIDVSVRLKPIRGVEIRERRSHGGEVAAPIGSAFRTPGANAKGGPSTAPRTLDFRARLRLLKRAGDLAALEAGRESLEQCMGDYWRLYAETRLEPSTRRKSGVVCVGVGRGDGSLGVL